MDKRDNNIREYFGEITSLLDREAYDYYRKNRRRPSKAIDDYQKYHRAVARLFMIIADGIAEEEEGVYVPRLGYFTNIPKGKKRKRNSLTLKTTNYKVCFFPDYETYPLSMDGTGFVELMLKVNKSGIKYKSLFNLTYSYRLSNDEAKKRKDSRTSADQQYDYNQKFAYIDELT